MINWATFFLRRIVREVKQPKRQAITEKFHLFSVDELFVSNGIYLARFCR